MPRVAYNQGYVDEQRRRFARGQVQPDFWLEGAEEDEEEGEEGGIELATLSEVARALLE